MRRKVEFVANLCIDLGKRSSHSLFPFFEALLDGSPIFLFLQGSHRTLMRFLIYNDIDDVLRLVL